MQSYSFRFQADSSLADITKLSLMFGHGKLPDGYISEVCDVIYDNIKIVEVDNLGADTMAPSISASDKSVYVGTPVDVLALATISDDQDANPEVTVEIKKDGAVVDAIDTSVAGVYNIKYTAKDVAGNEASKEIVLTIKDKPTTSMPIENGEEAASVANGGWIEWHDQNWVGSNVAVSEALVGPSELKLSFQYTSGTNWFGMQLFYTDAAIPAGAINIVMDINSTAAGKVTIAGQVVELAVGDNHLEIAGATSATGATLSWQFGDASESTNIAGATIVVSSLSINEKVVIGEGAEGTSGFDLGFIEEKDAVANPGTIGYWNDQWWCGSNVTVSQANYNNGTLSVSYLMEGFCAFGFQIFLDDATVAVGESKVISMKIVADTAGTITVCGTVVELVVGENNIEVTATKAADNALFEIIFGDTSANTAIAGGTFVISDCSFFDVIVPPTPVVPGPGEGEEDDEKVVIPAEGLLNNDLSKWVAWSEAAQAIKAELVEGKLVLTLNSTGAGVNYSPQFKLEGLAFEAGKTYEVEIILASSIARSVQVMVQENGGSWAVLASPIQALVAEEVTTIKFEVTATASYGNAIFGLMLGKLDGVETPEGEHTITITKLSLIEKEAQGGGSEEGGNEETPVVNECFDVVANTTAGAANNFSIKWKDAAYKVTKEPTKADCGVSVGIVANFEFLVLNDEFVQVNIITGAEPARNVSIVLHTESGDYKVTMIIEGGVYVSSTVEKVDCTHGGGSEEGGNEETPVVNECFDVVANTTAGAANNFSIKWKDAAYKVTKEPTKADCGVSVGIVANFEFLVLNDEFVQVNIITGAEPARNVSIVLHTEAGDYKVTMIIEGGAYVSSTVEKVDCTHVEIPDDGEDIVVDNGNLEVLGAFFYAGNHCEFHFKVADVLFDASYTYTVTCEDYPSGRVINQFVFGGDGIGIQFFIDGSTVTGKTYVFNITVANGDTVLASGQIAVVA